MQTETEAVNSDAAKVEAWRLHVLLEAGYQRKRAETLAQRVEIDLHKAVDLIKAGCDQRTAMQILT